ncbi:MAG TPA: hypothetical protein VK034_11565 [Enhygromyxa sp.]|nr:hypothetical protein [Enhygromyxa sp.]
MEEKIDVRTVASAFSRRLAAHSVKDDVVEMLAKRVAAIGAKPIDIDVCQYGVCIDYWIPRKNLGELLNRMEVDYTLGGIKVFPKGILNPDAFLVSVEHHVRR